MTQQPVVTGCREMGWVIGAVPLPEARPFLSNRPVVGFACIVTSKGIRAPQTSPATPGR